MLPQVYFFGLFLLLLRATPQDSFFFLIACNPHLLVHWCGKSAGACAPHGRPGFQYFYPLLSPNKPPQHPHMCSRPMEKFKRGSKFQPHPTPQEEHARLDGQESTQKAKATQQSDGVRGDKVKQAGCEKAEDEQISKRQWKKKSRV